MRVNIKLQIAVKYEAWIELFSIFGTFLPENRTETAKKMLKK